MEMKNDMGGLTFIDFFAGIGGFRRGLEMAGHKCIGFCEWDKFATASYVSMHCITEEQRAYLATLDLKKRQKEILKDEYRNGEWYADDIRGVDAGDLPGGVQLYCFGAPCQDFSVAGRREGLDGERSVLIREIFRILEEQKEQDRPEWLIYENVKGMLSSNRGLDYLSILSEMDRLGYDCEWQNINSAWYVPQNRERIYTIGHLRRYGSAKIFPISATDGENRVSIIGHRDGYRRNTQTFTPDGITEAMDTGAGGGRGHFVAEPCFCDMAYGSGFSLYDKAHCIPRKYSSLYGYHKKEKDGVAIPIQITDDIKLYGNNYNQRKTVNGNGEASRTVMGCGHSGNEPKVAIPISTDENDSINKIGHISGGQTGKIYGSDGKSPTLNTRGGVDSKVAIPVLTPDRTKKRQNGRRMKDDGDPAFTLTAEDRHGVALGVIDTQGRTEKTVDPKETAPTLRAQTHGNVPEVVEQVDTETDQHEPIYVQFENGVTAYAIWYEKYQCYITIRKLTPKECFRLQGWSDDYFDKAEFVNSDSQLYRQAGNGVTVNVIAAIGEKLYEEMEHENIV